MAISIRPAQKSLLFRIDEFMARPDSEQRGRASFEGLLVKHDLLRKPISTFRDHALASLGRLRMTIKCPAYGREQSLRPDAALLHHALPLLHFLLDVGGEFGRAHLHDLRAL